MNSRRNRINNNTLARDVAKREGGHDNQNIGEIKEIQRITFEELVNNHESIDILNMLERYRK